MDQNCCVECKKTSQQVPLLELTYQDKKYYVCPQHLPLFIHKPENLIGKIPGAENFEQYQ